MTEPPSDIESETPREQVAEGNATAFIAWVAAALFACACGKSDPSPRSEPERSAPTSADAAPDHAEVAWIGEPFELPKMHAERIEAGFRVEITLQRRSGVPVPRGNVPFTAERYTIAARPPEGPLAEADLMGTGLAIDLDGDGQTTSALPASCTDGAARVGSALLAPLGSADMSRLIYRAEEGGPRIARLGDAGAHLVLYAPCSEHLVQFGVSPAGQALAIEEVPGPALQLLLVEQSAGPEAAPQSSLAALRAPSGAEPVFGPTVAHVYEPVLSEPRWHTVQWAFLPIEAEAETQSYTIDVRIEGEPNAPKRPRERIAEVRHVLIARVNVSPVPGERLRLSAGFAVLE